ncbi:metallophosphoesterase [Candidatus Woesearchaeota archaeon]|nr:metallophosphoesterase [Candidatus Woesearchaeota archaeon]
MDRIILVVSDIELGDGTIVDDFIYDDLFSSFIDSYLIKRYDDIPIELVFNGDTFDFIKTSHKGEYSRYITDSISLHKLSLFTRAHPKFFAAVSRFLRKKKNVAIFIYGNHDPDLAFENVQQKLKNILKGNVVFSGFYYKQGSVRIEHGAQLDLIYKVEKNPLIPYKGNLILNLPFVTYVIFEHLVRMKQKYPVFEAISPRKLFLKRTPYLSKQLIYSNVKYFLKTLVKIIKNGDDPTYKLPKGYFKKITSRLISRRYDVSFDRVISKFLKRLKGTDILILGHSHKAKEERVKHKLLINTGTWREEYILPKSGNLLKPKSKYFAEIIMAGNKVLGARLIKHKSINKYLDLDIFKEQMESG